MGYNNYLVIIALKDRYKFISPLCFVYIGLVQMLHVVVIGTNKW